MRHACSRRYQLGQQWDDPGCFSDALQLVLLLGHGEGVGMVWMGVLEGVMCVRWLT